MSPRGGTDFGGAHPSFILSTGRPYLRKKAHSYLGFHRGAADNVRSKAKLYPSIHTRMHSHVRFVTLCYLAFF